MNGMIVGFTGTRNGMRGVQRFTLENKLLALWTPGAWFHHGACIGADEQAAMIARELGYRLHAHPPLDTSWMSLVVSDESEEPREYLDRNRDIVLACSVLVAAPATRRAVVRSGTWFTWRCATKVKKPRVLVYPDGTSRGFGLDTLL